MAIAFGQVQSINRRSGRSPQAAAAYRAGTRLVDGLTGRIHDYSRRRGVVHSEITAPDDAPWATERQRLWDEAGKADSGATRTVAREWLGALPHELSPEGRAAVCRSFAAWLVERHGVAVDWSIHAPDPRAALADAPAEHQGRNDHVHMLVTSRTVLPTGMGAKTRELDNRATSGAHIEAWRQQWEATVNARLELEQHAARIDMRSYQRQGRHRQGLPKLGPSAAAIERRGAPSDAGNRIRAVRRRNGEADLLGRRLVREWKALSEQEAAMQLETQKTIPTGNPWKGQTVPLIGGVRPIGGSGKKSSRETRKLPTAEERQAWKADRLSSHYDADLHHHADAIRQVRFDRPPYGIQLTDWSWVRDHGEKVCLHGAVSDQSVNVMADVMQAKGWQRVEIWGDDEFKARMWLECTVRGMEVTNYEPPAPMRDQLLEAAGVRPAEPVADSHAATADLDGAHAPRLTPKGVVA